MALPQLTEAETNALIAQAAEYLESQRERFVLRAQPLSESQIDSMRGFFPDEVLRDARVIVLGEETLHNPEFIAKLRERGFDFLFDIGHLNAIPLLEVIVFHREINKRLLFHGLVHFVQQRILGVPRWLELYVRALLQTGLHVTIPIEVHAYELDGRFALNPAAAFSVPSEVQAWSDQGRY